MNAVNESCEVVVIGAGIVGLAVAAELSKKGKEVIVLESEKDIVQHASSHNSEIIHSGIYYRNESLKASLCLEGNKLLYEYCEMKGISHHKLGKLIVASNKKELEILESLLVNGINNGLENLRIIGKGEIKKIEPMLNAQFALSVESTGVINSHEFALGLLAEIEEYDNHVVTSSRVTDAYKNRNSWTLEVGGEEPYIINTDILINSSGYSSVDLGRKLGIKSLPSPTFVKGHYYKYHGKNPFTRLIYPIPEKNGLGIHTSTDMANTLRFGPDAEIISKPDYFFDASPERLLSFSKSIQKYFKGFKQELLHQDFCGVRIRVGDSHNSADFSILFEEDHEITGLINLCGIESPGLTSALSIAKYIGKKL